MAQDGLKVMDADMHRDLGVQVGESVFPLPTRSYANAIAPLMTGQQDIYAEAERGSETAAPR